LSNAKPLPEILAKVRDPDTYTAYAKHLPCMRSGECCKRNPCGFGASKSDTDKSCVHLLVDEEIEPGLFTYRCGQIDYILTQPGWEGVPAFGGGCCSPMFNENRSRLVALAGIRPKSST
jgi:hypothetical protein